MSAGRDFEHSLLVEDQQVEQPATKASWRTALVLGGAFLLAFGFIGLVSSGRKAESEGVPAAPQFLRASECDDPTFTSKFMKTAYEQTYFALLDDTKGQAKFEASDLVVVNDTIYAVCDNSWAIGRFERSLTPFSKGNREIWSPEKMDGSDSMWEAIVYDDQEHVFVTVQEAVPHSTILAEGSGQRLSGNANNAAPAGESAGEAKEEHYHALLQELRLSENGRRYSVVNECPSEFRFPSGNKGFEGAASLRGVDGRFYILALCEGNFCEGEERGMKAGNGRLVLMVKEDAPNKGAGCMWKTVQVYNIPSTANFVDYASVAVIGSKIAVASQASSAVWEGEMVLTEKGLIDPATFAVRDFPKPRVLGFPRDDECAVVYCNVEGISYLNERLLAAVSDKMKGKGRQDFRCETKDQSVHVFALP